MTRDELLDTYDVDSRGVIQSPGKFEGEPLYVPHYWDMSGDGSCDMLTWSDGSTVYVVTLDATDYAEWPELTGVHALAMQESESGFVSCATHTAESLAELEADCESDESDDESEDE